MESSGATCPGMESLVEDTESRVDCGPLLATSLMDLSPEKSEDVLCTGRQRFVLFKVFKGLEPIVVLKCFLLAYQTGALHVLESFASTRKFSNK